MAIEAAPTVRDSLVAAMDTVVEQPAPAAPAEAAPVDAAPAAPQTPEAKPAAVETEAQKAERLRNEDGTFAKGKAPEKPKSEAAVATPAEPPKPKVPRPSSWKKELEPHWDTLAPEVQAYVRERESQYATGVSTYKTEADRAKDVMASLAEFEPILQERGVQVSQWLKNLGHADRTLSYGSPQDKVQQVARIIQGYGVDAQALFAVLSGQQPQYAQQQQPMQPPQPRFSPQDIEKVVEQKLLSQRAASDYESFTKATNADGTPKYPYLEDVKGTMAGLLQAGLAQDYPSAYDAAVRLPQHANIWEVLQQQQNAKTEAERVQAATATAQRARSQAVSVKSATPTVTPAPAGAKDRRSMIADAFDAATVNRV